MNPYFNSAERINALTTEALAWIGTPWCANSMARGNGVSCHNLPRCIYIGCGWLTDSFPKPMGDPNASRFTKISAMETFLDGRAEFRRLGANEKTKSGDLLGIKVGPCINHLGVALSEGNFIHVLMLKKTDLDPFEVPPWSQRTAAVWRPLEYAKSQS